MGDPGGGGSQDGGGLSASMFNELVQRMSRRVLEAGQQLKEVLESKPLSSLSDQQILELLQQTSSESSPSSSQGPSVAPSTSSIKQENSIPIRRTSTTASVKLEEEDVITLSDSEDDDDQTQPLSSPGLMQNTSYNQTNRTCNDSIKIENEEEHRSLPRVRRANRKVESREESPTNARTRTTVKLEPDTSHREENHPQRQSEHADEVQSPRGNRKDADSRSSPPRPAASVPKIEKEEDVSTSGLPNAIEEFMGDNERRMSQSFQDVIEVSSSSDDEEKLQYPLRRRRRSHRPDQSRNNGIVKQEVSTTQPSRSPSLEVILLDDDDDEPPRPHKTSNPRHSASSLGSQVDNLSPITVKSEIPTPLSTCEAPKNVKVEASSPATITLGDGNSPGPTKSCSDSSQKVRNLRSFTPNSPSLSVITLDDDEDFRDECSVQSTSRRLQGLEIEVSNTNIEIKREKPTTNFPCGPEVITLEDDVEEGQEEAWFETFNSSVKDESSQTMVPENNESCTSPPVSVAIAMEINDDADTEREAGATPQQSSGGMSVHGEVDESETTLLVDSDSSNLGKGTSFSQENVPQDLDQATVSNDSVEAQTTATSILKDKGTEPIHIEDENASAPPTSSETDSNIKAAANDAHGSNPSPAASLIPPENKETDDEDANLATDTVHPEEVDSEDNHDKGDHAVNLVVVRKDIDFDDIVSSDDNDKLDKSLNSTFSLSSDTENNSDHHVRSSRRPSSSTPKKDARKAETTPSRKEEMGRDDKGGDGPASDDESSSVDLDVLDSPDITKKKKNAASDLESSASSIEESRMALVLKTKPVSVQFRRPIPSCFRSNQSEMEEVKCQSKRDKRSCFSSGDESDEEPLDLKTYKRNRTDSNSNDDDDFGFNFRSPTRTSAVSDFATAGSEAPDPDDILDFSSELYGPTVTTRTQPNYIRRAKPLPPGTKVEWRDPPIVPRPIQPTRFATTHRRSAPDDSDIRCELCDKPFLTNQGLQGHLKDKICTGGLRTRFGCRKCDITYARAADLDIHMNHVHEKSITWGCRKCLEKFTSPSSRNHHEENCHQCDNCNGCFYGKEKFEKHKAMCDALMQT